MEKNITSATLKNIIISKSQMIIDVIDAKEDVFHKKEISMV